MKPFVYWLRWASLTPAYFVGLCVGPLIMTLIVARFAVPWGDHLYLTFYLLYGSSAFGAVLFCAWDAPRLKGIVAIVALLLTVVFGTLIRYGSDPGDKGGWPTGWWPMPLAYLLGGGLALALFQANAFFRANSTTK
jgi:hypothetical protein